MADNLLLPISLEQITGSDGEVFVSAVYVYDAGTTDLKNVYTDVTLLTAAANPIIADGDGVLPARYVGTGSYKLVIKDTVGYPTEDLSAHWTTFKTTDNLPGALDTSTFASDQATPITPVISKTSDFTVLTSQQGTVFDVDPTGGNVTATLPSAVTAGDDFRITFKNTGTANSVIISAVSAQTIDGETTYTLEDQYEGVTLVSDGANWLISESARLSPPPSDYPPGHLYGLKLSNGSDTTNDIQFAAGKCRDQADTYNLNVSSALVKQLDASWVAGTNVGGRSSAGLSDGTWHCFVIGKVDGTTDCFFHSALDPSAVLPSGYTLYRRVGSVIRASSSIIQFLQEGDEFLLKSSATEIGNTAPGNTTRNTLTLSGVPGDIVVTAIISYNCGTNGTAYVSSPDQADEAPSSSGPPSNAGSPTGGTATTLRVRTNTSRQICYRLSSNGPLSIATLGFVDGRGRT